MEPVRRIGLYGLFALLVVASCNRTKHEPVGTSPSLDPTAQAPIAEAVAPASLPSSASAEPRTPEKPAPTTSVVVAKGPPIVLNVPSNARPSFKTSFVDCVKHTEWTIPPEWQTTSAGTTETAWNHERDAAIVRMKTGDHSGKALEAIASRLVGPAVTLVFLPAAQTMTGERTLTTRAGHGTNAQGESVITIELSQSDDKGLNVGSPRDLDTAWVRVAGGLLRDETMTRIRKVDDVVLPSDACKCSYDCVSRR